MSLRRRFVGAFLRTTQLPNIRTQNTLEHLVVVKSLKRKTLK